jgi:hypothetical protein
MILEPTTDNVVISEEDCLTHVVTSKLEKYMPCGDLVGAQTGLRYSRGVAQHELVTIDIYVYVCMYVCMCVCIYIYIYIYNLLR